MLELRHKTSGEVLYTLEADSLSFERSIWKAQILQTPLSVASVLSTAGTCIWPLGWIGYSIAHPRTCFPLLLLTWRLYARASVTCRMSSCWEWATNRRRST